jgi:hypothetical protein
MVEISKVGLSFRVACINIVRYCVEVGYPKEQNLITYTAINMMKGAFEHSGYILING